MGTNQITNCCRSYCSSRYKTRERKRDRDSIMSKFTFRRVERRCVKMIGQSLSCFELHACTSDPSCQIQRINFHSVSLSLLYYWWDISLIIGCVWMYLKHRSLFSPWNYRLPTLLLSLSIDMYIEKCFEMLINERIQRIRQVERVSIRLSKESKKKWTTSLSPWTNKRNGNV